MDCQNTKSPSPFGRSSVLVAIGLLTACLVTGAIVCRGGDSDPSSVDKPAIGIVPYPPLVAPPCCALGTPTAVAKVSGQAEEVAQARCALGTPTVATMASGQEEEVAPELPVQFNLRIPIPTPPTAPSVFLGVPSAVAMAPSVSVAEHEAEPAPASKIIQASTEIAPPATSVKHSAELLPPATVRQSADLLPSTTVQQSADLLPSTTVQQSADLPPPAAVQQSAGLRPRSTIGNVEIELPQPQLLGPVVNGAHAGAVTGPTSSILLFK